MTLLDLNSPLNQPTGFGIGKSFKSNKNECAKPYVEALEHSSR